MRAIFLGIALCLATTPARAVAEIGPTDPAELEAFLAGLLPSLMETHHVPGAVFVMVKNGEIFFAKGYGYADLETQRPVDPETTIFRVASVSKLFTATAAMQLVEQGKLDLNVDVNRYLEEFQIEATYGEPVTLHHLLVHTAGFDDRFLRSSRTIGSELPPLGQYLAERMPPRVMPPGRFISYSNHGLALVGHLVEVASGTPFPAYVREHVLDPLGMTRSRVFLSVPLSPDLASSYQYRSGQQVEMGYDHTLLGPAAELNTTGMDMARFMIAHLQMGRLGDQRILGEETARMMQTRHFTHHPKLDGRCYGFVESYLKGVRTIGHGGDWRGFRTSLVLVPAADLGIFISVNGNFRGPFYRTFANTLADRYFPGPEPTLLEAPDDFAGRASLYAGTYLPNRRIRGTILKLGEFLGAIRVTANDDDTLTVSFLAGEDPIRLAEVEPDLFREQEGEIDAAFLRDERGRVRHLALEEHAFDRIPLYRSPLVHAILAGITLLLFVGTLGGWTIGAGARMVAGGSASPVSLPARTVASAVCLLDAVALIGIALVLRQTDLFELLYESIPTSLKQQLLLPLVSLPLTLALPYSAWRGFPASGQATLARLHYGVLTGAAFLFLAMAHYWNLLGFHY